MNQSDLVKGWLRMRIELEQFMLIVYEQPKSFSNFDIAHWSTSVDLILEGIKSFKNEVALYLGDAMKSKEKIIEAILTSYQAVALQLAGDDVDGQWRDGLEGLPISDETLNDMRKDCEVFFDMSSDVLHLAAESRGVSIDDSDFLDEVGTDFLLTRCDHGSGFWDGDWGDYGDALTGNANTFANLDLYVGDDGKVYGS